MNIWRSNQHHGADAYLANRSSDRASKRRKSSIILFGALLLGAASVTEIPGTTASFNQAHAKPAYSVEISKGRIVRLRRPAKTVFVADPNIADVQVKSSRLIYLFGKKVGETTLIAVDAADRVLLNAGVTVNHNISRMRRAIRALLPGNAIKIRSLDGAVMLTGSVASQADAVKAQDVAARFVTDASKEIVNQIKVTGPTQVNLRVRVLEINKNTIRRLGINWDAVAAKGKFAFGLATGSVPTIVNGLFSLRTGTPSSNGIGIRFNDGVLDLSNVINALDKEGLVKVLAEPNLSAMSGQKASFLAGGEFPVPVGQDGGTITIEFKKFGVSLEFTPVILSANRIKITVAPEVSTLSNQGEIRINNIAIPSLSVRRAKTQLVVASGQSIVLGGLLQNNLTKDVSKVPWLGDIPILGKLFTSQEFQRNETELVIIATPYVVKPLSKRGALVARSASARPSAIMRRTATDRRTHTARGRVIRGRAPATRSSLRPTSNPSGFVLE